MKWYVCGIVCLAALWARPSLAQEDFSESEVFKNLSESSANHDEQEPRFKKTIFRSVCNSDPFFSDQNNAYTSKHDLRLLLDPQAQPAIKVETAFGKSARYLELPVLFKAYNVLKKKNLPKFKQQSLTSGQVLLEVRKGDSYYQFGSFHEADTYSLRLKCDPKIPLLVNGMDYSRLCNEQTNFLVGPLFDKGFVNNAKVGPFIQNFIKRSADKLPEYATEVEAGLFTFVSTSDFSFYTYPKKTERVQIKDDTPFQSETHIGFGVTCKVDHSANLLKNLDQLLKVIN